MTRGDQPARGGLLVLADVGIMEESLRNGVEALEQSLAVGFGDVENQARLDLVRRGADGVMEGNRLVTKVDGYRGGSGILPAGLGDRLPIVLGQLDGQKAV